MKAVRAENELITWTATATARRLAVYAADRCGTFAEIKASKMCGRDGALAIAIGLQRRHPGACIWVQDNANTDLGFDGLSDDERAAVEVQLAKVRRAA